MGTKRGIKKILVAAPLYPPEIGGPATYVKMLEEELPQHGFTLTVVPFSSVRKYPKVLRHFMYTFFLLKKAWGIDMIYALDPVSVGLPARLVCILTQKPFWVRLGGDYAWEQGQQRFGLTQMLDEYTQNKAAAPWQVRALAEVQSFVVRGAQKVVVPSTYMAGVVRTWGATEEQLEVVYSALHPLPVPLDKKDYRRKFGFSGPVVFSAGRLVPWKGFQELIDIVDQLREQHPDIKLLIAGDGPTKGELHEHIAEKDLSSCVQLLDRLPKDELGQYIKAADVFVLNTAYEGLSHQLLEVMALGTPVVATDVGGNPELIEDGTSGYLVPLGDIQQLHDRLHTLLSDEQLQQAFAQAAQVQTENFTSERGVESLINLLRS